MKKKLKGMLVTEVFETTKNMVVYPSAEHLKPHVPVYKKPLKIRREPSKEAVERMRRHTTGGVLPFEQPLCRMIK